MNTKYLYIGKNNLFIEKAKNIGQFAEMVQIKYPLSAVQYLKNNADVNVVIYEAESNSPLALQYIYFYKESINKDTVFFILVHRKGQMKELFVEGVDDVFFIDGDISKVYKRAEFLIACNNQAAESETDDSDVRRFPVWKRAMDIVFALLAITLVSPVFLLIAISIRLESKGKVIYSSKRIGTGYKLFNFYKFRSMYTGADKKVEVLMKENQYGASSEKDIVDFSSQNEPTNRSVLLSDEEMILEQDYLQKKNSKSSPSFFKLANDPRITKVGRIIRNTSLDELPQLFNILMGDMSVVGNRPLPLYEAEMLTSDEWISRFLAPAGLTGLWQVTKRGGANGMSADERKQLDIDYANHYSFFGDLSIILRTFPALLQHENV
jgi:lipopolysaccharide/colanic/teichoic acid biosynthesis glycosyltransferase